MKICIKSVGRDLNSDIDPRFGRCNFFIIYDVETNKFEAVDNSWKEATGGAGIQAAQFVIQKGVKKVFTGRVGANAETVLKQAGIEIVEASGKVDDIIKSC
ncbi:NifB/NifX family molybdenum-iron cluster-binding protein [Thermodesulfovibrio sp.]|uniref:NifB/NifX family molybdenum-iron cluster-binding protein n=1 Tax=Thermodesulfovibrio sp. TaxID=2067987 RepID=UPI0030A38DAF